MQTHEEKINRIIQQLQNRSSTEPVSFRKKAVSHEVPRLNDRRYSDEKIDLSALKEILHIDTEKQICIAEPGITFDDLVKATLTYGLVPAIVPELKTITIGGAVAGCSLESMSFKYGGFHDTCLEYEVITAKGEVLVCTPGNENNLLFQMVHGTFGTLGIISRLTFRLIPAKPFIRVTYERYQDLKSYLAAIWQHYADQDADFMDGIIHSPESWVLSVGHFTDMAPYTHRYDWMRIYYQSTGSRTEDYLRTKDYFFRYDRGVTNVTPKSFLGRLFLGRFITSARTLMLVKKFRRWIPPEKIPVTVDVFIPFSKVSLFMDWYHREMDHFPLWCVPYKLVRRYEWISGDFLSRVKDELFLDLAIYGMKKKGDKNVYRILEEKLMDTGGIKTLISGNYYTESEFWKIWNKDNYDRIKRQTDPENIFRDLYTKTCRAAMGKLA